MRGALTWRAGHVWRGAGEDEEGKVEDAEDKKDKKKKKVQEVQHEWNLLNKQKPIW